MSNSQTAASLEQEVAETFVRRLYGQWSDSEQAALELRLAADLAYARAWRFAGEEWGAFDGHAATPEGMAWREEAIAAARRAQARRWLKPHRYSTSGWRTAAGVAGVALLLAGAWQVSPYGYRPGQYRTDVGEQKTVELADRTHVVLDAATHMRVRYTNDARVVEFQQGQAQFTVASDPARPFKVQVGDRTVIALGTTFAVDRSDQGATVAMVEGKVAVLGPGAAPVELTAGEGLRIDQTGRVTRIPKAALDAVLAWRERRVVFRGEPLEQAVQRMQRYSALRIRIRKDALRGQPVSGVFEADDATGFLEALERYYPVTVTRVSENIVELK